MSDKKETFEEWHYSRDSYVVDTIGVAAQAWNHQQAKIDKLEQENKNFYDKLLECSSNFYRKNEENKNLLAALKKTISRLGSVNRSVFYKSKEWKAVENLK